MNVLVAKLLKICEEFPMVAVSIDGLAELVLDPTDEEEYVKARRYDTVRNELIKNLNTALLRISVNTWKRDYTDSIIRIEQGRVYLSRSNGRVMASLYLSEITGSLILKNGDLTITSKGGEIWV